MDEYQRKYKSISKINLSFRGLDINTDLFF